MLFGGAKRKKKSEYWFTQGGIMRSRPQYVNKDIRVLSILHPYRASPVQPGLCFVLRSLVAKYLTVIGTPGIHAGKVPFLCVTKTPDKFTFVFFFFSHCFFMSLSGACLLFPPSVCEVGKQAWCQRAR